MAVEKNYQWGKDVFAVGWKNFQEALIPSSRLNPTYYPTAATQKVVKDETSPLISIAAPSSNFVPNPVYRAVWSVGKGAGFDPVASTAAINVMKDAPQKEFLVRGTGAGKLLKDLFVRPSSFLVVPPLVKGVAIGLEIATQALRYPIEVTRNRFARPLLFGILAIPLLVVGGLSAIASLADRMIEKAVSKPIDALASRSRGFSRSGSVESITSVSSSGSSESIPGDRQNLAQVIRENKLTAQERQMLSALIRESDSTSKMLLIAQFERTKLGQLPRSSNDSRDKIFDDAVNAIVENVVEKQFQKKMLLGMIENDSAREKAIGYSRSIAVFSDDEAEGGAPSPTLSSLSSMEDIRANASQKRGKASRIAIAQALATGRTAPGLQDTLIKLGKPNPQGKSAGHKGRQDLVDNLDKMITGGVSTKSTLEADCAKIVRWLARRPLPKEARVAFAALVHGSDREHSAEMVLSFIRAAKQKSAATKHRETPLYQERVAEFHGADATVAGLPELRTDEEHFTLRK